MRTGDRSQKSEVRGQKAEDRGRRTDGQFKIDGQECGMTGTKGVRGDEGTFRMRNAECGMMKIKDVRGDEGTKVPLKCGMMNAECGIKGTGHCLGRDWVISQGSGVDQEQ